MVHFQETVTAPSCEPCDVDVELSSSDISNEDAIPGIVLGDDFSSVVIDAAPLIQPGEVPTGPAWLLDAVDGLEDVFLSLSHVLKFMLRGDGGEPAMLERQRDIFPLPLVDAKIGIELCVLHDECDLIPFDVVVRVANLSLQALNALAGFVAPDARRGSCAPQRAAQLRAKRDGNRQKRDGNRQKRDGKST